jgi:glycosyltransferase involved in cell wall biosynthesis
MWNEAPPAVSVVLPVFNDEAFVASAILSVLAQTYADFELIIVDDGCTDRSMDICATFDDPRIVIVREAHRGLAGARNTGILHARGTYVALLDSSDMWAPEKLEVHVAHLESDENIGASTSAIMMIDTEGRPTGVVQRPKTGPITARDVYCGRVVLSASAPVFRWEMLIESALPEDASGRHRVFDERLRRSEDMECWTRLAVTSRFRFETIDRPLTQFRVIPGSMSADIIRQIDSWDAASELISHIAPEFIEECGAEGRACKLSQLARSCVQMRDRGLGLTLACEAVSHFPGLLWREPAKTLATLLACLAMRLLPQRKSARLLLVARSALAGGLAP